MLPDVGNVLSKVVETDFDTELKNFLNRYSKASPHLMEAIRYSLLAPGKRIRPKLALACSEMLDLSREAALPAALSLEMVHCFTLIHDDLPCLDNDDFRRGQPSNHKQFGEALALLAGDALLTMAWEALADAASLVSAQNFFSALKEFSRAIGPLGAIGGQAAELQLDHRSSLSALEQVHTQKTGTLFLASLLIPRALAGISSQDLKGAAIEELGLTLGLAFQTSDDIEDSPPEGAPQEPNSILFFKSKLEAAEFALKRLKASQNELMKAWGDRAHPLLEISKEVESRLQHCYDSNSETL